MKFCLIFLLLSTSCAIKRPVQAQLKIDPARYSLEDNGFAEGVPCDTPLSAEEKAAGLSCMKKTQSWTIRCDDPRTIDILPRVNNPLFYDFGEAQERGEKFWCVIPVEKKHRNPLLAMYCDLRSADGKHCLVWAKHPQACVNGPQTGDCTAATK